MGAGEAETSSSESSSTMGALKLDFEGPARALTRGGGGDGCRGDGRLKSKSSSSSESEACPSRASIGFGSSSARASLEREKVTKENQRRCSWVEEGEREKETRRVSSPNLVVDSQKDHRIEFRRRSETGGLLPGGGRFRLSSHRRFLGLPRRTLAYDLDLLVRSRPGCSAGYGRKKGQLSSRPSSSSSSLPAYTHATFPFESNKSQK